MPFVAFDDIGQRRQLGLFWVAFDAAHQRVGAVQEHAVHFVRHFRKARYCLGMMWSRTASFFAGSLTMRNASFAAMLSLHGQTPHNGAYPARMTKTKPLAPQ
jgi:hypothetical protein